MKLIDGHCDVLYKLWKKDIDFYKDIDFLDVSFNKLKSFESLIQTFAIFVPPRIPKPFYEALLQIDLFYQKIIKDNKFFSLITTKEDLIKEKPKFKALLALEGAHVIGENLEKLRILKYLGVLQVGLTWNNSNFLADGVMEKRNAGLSNFGIQVIKEMQRLNMIVDVSHLSKQSFYDVLEFEIPIVASHSNCFAVCKHPRNLDDEQLKMLIDRNCLIGITFVPDFIKEKKPVIEDLIKHLDHICNLGGSKNIYFGSDFDGFDSKIKGLENANSWFFLMEFLRKYYTLKDIRAWFFENAFNFYSTNLK